MCGQAHSQTQTEERVTESHPPGSLNYFFGVFLPGFLQLIIFICLVHSPYFVYLRILPYVCTHLSVKLDSTTKASGQTSISQHHSPLTSKDRFCVHMWSGRSPDFENKKYILWAGPAAPSPLVLFSGSVMSNSATPWTATHQASLSITNSQNLLKLMSIEPVKPSNHLILCRPLLPPSIFASIRIFSNESVL